ncbi:MAG: hypothetical protein QNJ73_03895 [Gammaproteobacteria bacterium]|nr:hypothetical protein [Gammaproteobacteria bacterium]
MSVVITLLVTFAVAFPAGWLLCRAWLAASASGTVSRRQHHDMLQAQRSRYRKRVQQIHALVKHHESSRDKVRAKLADQKQHLDKMTEQLAERAEEVANLRNAHVAAEQRRARAEQKLEEAENTITARANDGTAQDSTLLRIERDELLARVQRLEAESDANARAAEERDAEAEATVKAERGELRDRLTSSERRVRELENQITERDHRIEELREEVESWKHRLAPMARQLQKHKEIIRRGADAAKKPEPEEDLPRDNLQKIRGIGPALERRLRAQGVHNFAQLAAMSPDELEGLADRLAIAPTLPARDEWVRQAVELSSAQNPGHAVAEGASPS